MKRLLCLLVVAASVSAGAARAADPELKSEDDKTIYALGLVLANQLAPFQFTPAELAILESGLGDGLAAKTPKVDLEAYGPKIQPLGQQRRGAFVAQEKKKGDEFLAKVAAKDGVKKLADGLLMETVSVGTGAGPAPGDTVKVNYKGTLIDGKVFDTSEKHGGPQTMKLDTKVIKCWQQGLQFMKVGGKAKLYCPADLAYGDRGQGQDIPPGAALTFEVELVDIVK
jgi:FKBP-type peptidyl-prolyl cis-trans isomerase FkpA